MQFLTVVFIYTHHHSNNLCHSIMHRRNVNCADSCVSLSESLSPSTEKVDKGLPCSAHQSSAQALWSSAHQSSAQALWSSAHQKQRCVCGPARTKAAPKPRGPARTKAAPKPCGPARTKAACKPCGPVRTKAAGKPRSPAHTKAAHKLCSPAHTKAAHKPSSPAYTKAAHKPSSPACTKREYFSISVGLWKCCFCYRFRFRHSTPTRSTLGVKTAVDADASSTDSGLGISMRAEAVSRFCESGFTASGATASGATASGFTASGATELYAGRQSPLNCKQYRAQYFPPPPPVLKWKFVVQFWYRLIQWMMNVSLFIRNLILEMHKNETGVKKSGPQARFSYTLQEESKLSLNQSFETLSSLRFPPPPDLPIMHDFSYNWARPRVEAQLSLIINKCNLTFILIKKAVIDL